MLLLWRLAYQDGCGRTVEAACVATEIHLSHAPVPRDRAWLGQVLQCLDGQLQASIAAWTRARREHVAQVTRAFGSMRLARAHAIAQHFGGHGAGDTFQPGLFDRRAERLQLDAVAGRQRAGREQAAKLAQLAPGVTVAPERPELLLVLWS
jgi:hypothetical protein